MFAKKVGVAPGAISTLLTGRISVAPSAKVKAWMDEHESKIVKSGQSTFLGCTVGPPAKKQKRQ